MFSYKWFPRGDKILGEGKPRNAVILWLFVKGTMENCGQAVERLLFEASVNRWVKQWTLSNNNQDQKMCQPYFYPAEYTNHDSVSVFVYLVFSCCCCFCFSLSFSFFFSFLFRVKVSLSFDLVVYSAGQKYGLHILWSRSLLLCSQRKHCRPPWQVRNIRILRTVVADSFYYGRMKQEIFIWRPNIVPRVLAAP